MNITTREQREAKADALLWALVDAYKRGDSATLREADRRLAELQNREPVIRAEK